MKLKRKKKAFTLTELLVVVIVIGVLSAVVLPKFSKVIETRKTTEAEELMAAVRTEQEKRCALDKDYIADLSKLSDIIPSTNTKNFVYSTNEAGTGIEAQSKGKYGYTLKMPSYKDGRLCCENEEECLKLNKDYPLCSDLIARADYQSGAECAGDNRPTVVQCVGSSTQTCGCLGKGTQSRACNTTTGQWGAWSVCSAPLFCSCPADSKPAATQTCNGCGTQTRQVVCNTANGEWQPSAWGTCSKTVDECTDPCSTHPFDLVQEREETALCCKGSSVYVPETGETFTDAAYCCGTVNVCCFYPDGTSGNCDPMSSVSLSEKNSYCKIAGNGSHAEYVCGMPSSGGTTPGTNCTWGSGQQVQQTVSIDYTAGDVFEKISSQSDITSSFSIAGTEGWTPPQTCNTGGTCDSSGALCNNNPYLSNCKVTSADSGGTPASYSCTLTYTSRSCTCQ